MPGQEREHPTRGQQVPGHRLHIQNLALRISPSLHHSIVPAARPAARFDTRIVQGSPSPAGQTSGAVRRCLDELWLETDPPMDLDIDGEIRGRSPVQITLEANALRVMVPTTFTDT